jgi:hypothetical protein
MHMGVSNGSWQSPYQQIGDRSQAAIVNRPAESGREVLRAGAKLEPKIAALRQSQVNFADCTIWTLWKCDKWYLHKTCAASIVPGFAAWLTAS